MATVTTVSVYPGIWSLSSVANGKALGTWPYAPQGLWSWGGNAYGQLGLNNRTSYSSPKQLSGTISWNAIEMAGGGSISGSFGVDGNGALWSWGGNNNGQLGLGTSGAGTYKSSPTQVGALTNWSKVSASRFVLSIKTDGTLWSWGLNNIGQLGLGNITSYSSPKQVGALTTWLNISAGYSSSLAVKTDGTLWVWGENTYGQLGLNNRTHYSSPKQVGALTTWSTVAGGPYNSYGLKTDGTLWSWGANGGGQLGLGNTTSYSSPKQVGALTNWAKIAASKPNGYILAIKTNGTLWAWGTNDAGQLGTGNLTYYSSPKQIGALTTWSQISTNGNTTASIKTDGTLWMWGRSTSGQLGLGNTNKYSSPNQVGALTNWLKVSVGYTQTLAQYG